MLKSLGGIFDYDKCSQRFTALQEELNKQDVWQDSKRSQSLQVESKRLQKTIENLDELQTNYTDLADLWSMSEEENEISGEPTPFCLPRCQIDSLLPLGSSEDSHGEEALLCGMWLENI